MIKYVPFKDLPNIIKQYFIENNMKPWYMRCIFTENYTIYSSDTNVIEFVVVNMIKNKIIKQY